MNFSICKIDNDYVKKLNQVDSRVQYHHGSHDKPYLGVILEVNNLNYFVPLSSRKPKYLKMKEGTALVKIENEGKLLAVLNLNNMIPVPKSCIIKFSFNEIKDPNYKRLLIKEFKSCREKKQVIIAKAEKLHQIITTVPEKHPKIASYCVDFKKVEKFCNAYQGLNTAPKNKFEERLAIAEASKKNKPSSVQASNKKQL